MLRPRDGPAAGEDATEGDDFWSVASSDYGEPLEEEPGPRASSVSNASSKAVPHVSGFLVRERDVRTLRTMTP